MPAEFEGSSLHKCLVSFGEIDFFDLMRGLSSKRFREAYRRLVDGDFEVDPSVTGEAIGFRISYYSVGVYPKEGANSPQRLADFFRFVCSCGEPSYCEHLICAGLVLHKAATRKFGEVRPLAKMKLEELAQTLSRFPEAPSAEHEREGGRETVRLKAILFCIDGPPPKEFPVEIAPARPVSPAEILPRSRWVSPHDYARAPFNEPPDWDHPGRSSGGWRRGPSDCLFEIQYLFADETVLNAHEILYHRYGQTIRKELLPPLRDPCGDLAPFVPQDGNRYGFDPERIFLRLLQRAEERRSEDSLQILFVMGRDRNGSRRGLEIEKVQFVPAGEADSQAGFRIELDCNPPGRSKDTAGGCARLNLLWGPGILPFVNFLVDPSRRSLIFHPHVEAIRALAGLMAELSGDDEPVSLTPFLPDLLSRIRLRGHEEIDRLVREILHDRRLARSFSISPKGLEIPPEGKKARLSIAEDGTLRYAVRVNGSSDGGSGELGRSPEFAPKDPAMPVRGAIDVLNPGPWFRILLGALEDGIQVFLPQEKWRYVSRRDNRRRKAGLALLGHPGVSALLVMETARFLATQGVRLTQMAKKRFKKEVFEKIAALFPRTDGEGEKADLTKIVGHAVVDLLDAVVEQVIGQLVESPGEGRGDPVVVYPRQGPMIIHGYHRTLILFFGELIQRLVLRTHGSCLLKPRTPLFSVRPAGDGGDQELTIGGVEERDDSLAGGLLFSGTAKEDLLAAALSLPASLCEVFYSGVPAEGLDAGNFRAEFTLKEETGSGVTGSGGSRNLNWFDLHPRFFLNGVEIDEERVRNMNRTGLLEWNGRLYLIKGESLPSVAYLERFWNRLKSGTTNEPRPASEPGSVYRLPRHQTLELLLLRKKGVRIQGGPEWDKICAFYDSLDAPRKPEALPPSVHAELKPYQGSGVQWLSDLYRLGLGGILADDMGLGKTVQSLAFLEALRTRGEMGHVLILVPTSLTYNWLAEGKRFTPEMPLRIFQSRDKQGAEEFLKAGPQAGLICTYGLLVEHAEFFGKFSWNVHLYDEAQQLKNIGALRTSASRALPARFKLCLTGTPIENHLGECYSLLDLVVPGCLGDLDDFRKVYVNPAMIDREAISNLRLKIRPLILRRHKSEILKDLPEKMESLVILPFEDRQKKIYRDIAISWNEKVRESVSRFGEARSQIMMLTALLRLRQACSDPSALPKVHYPKDPPKTALLIESLGEITESGESALVFTQFLPTFERIKKRLEATGIRFFSLHGGMSHIQRKKEISAFQSCSEGAVFLMTLKTGGVGLNLTKATYVFHIEPWWNPAVENQATDRTHRIGQTGRVQVYRYLMRESVEEKIEILKKRKSDRFQAVFGIEETVGEEGAAGSDFQKPSGRLTKQDFDYLLEDGV